MHVCGKAEFVKKKNDKSGFFAAQKYLKNFYLTPAIFKGICVYDEEAEGHYVQG